MNKYVLRVLKCDNRLEFLMNGQCLTGRPLEYQDNPDLNLTFDITGRLQPNPAHNVIEVSGWNTPCSPVQPFRYNPWHFKYVIEKNGVATVTVDEDGPSESARVVDARRIHTRHTIVLAGGRGEEDVITTEKLPL